MTETRFLEFLAAWERRDLEAVTSFLAECCVYEGAVGQEPGAPLWDGRQYARHSANSLRMHHARSWWRLRLSAGRVGCWSGPRRIGSLMSVHGCGAAAIGLSSRTTRFAASAAFTRLGPEPISPWTKASCWPLSAPATTGSRRGWF